MKKISLITILIVITLSACNVNNSVTQDYRDLDNVDQKLTANQIEVSFFRYLIIENSVIPDLIIENKSNSCIFFDKVNDIKLYWKNGNTWEPTTDLFHNNGETKIKLLPDDEMLSNTIYSFLPDQSTDLENSNLLKVVIYFSECENANGSVITKEVLINMNNALSNGFSTQ